MENDHPSSSFYDRRKGKKERRREVATYDELLSVFEREVQDGEKLEEGGERGAPGSIPSTIRCRTYAWRKKKKTGRAL